MIIEAISHCTGKTDERIQQHEQSDQDEYLATKPVRATPDFIAGQSPRGADADKEVFSHFSHVIAKHDKQQPDTSENHFIDVNILSVCLQQDQDCDARHKSDDCYRKTH